MIDKLYSLGYLVFRKLFSKFFMNSPDKRIRVTHRLSYDLCCYRLAPYWIWFPRNTNCSDSGDRSNCLFYFLSIYMI